MPRKSPIEENPVRHASEPGPFPSEEIVGVCEFGATSEELQALLGDRLPVFQEWMRGQTMALCPEHGEIVYLFDLERFLAGHQKQRRTPEIQGL